MESATSSPEAAPAIGDRAVGSLAWMMANTAATRVVSFLAQIVLGWLLSEHDFGIYALAISISAVTTLLRDGGVRQLLITRQTDYQSLLGPVFWMAMAFNAGTGLLLAIAAPFAAKAYGEPSLVQLLLIIAVCMPLGTPGVILTTRLQIDLRFRSIATIQAACSLIRYVGAAAFAWWGFGPLSFVLPLPIIAIVEWLGALMLNRERLWRRSPHVGEWGGLFGQAKWVLIGSFAVALLNLGSNLVIGLFDTTETVGVYFFAFQIIIQIAVVLSANANQVLFAALARIAAEPERKRRAVIRSLRQIMLLSVPMCVGLAVTFGPLEEIVWRGRWAAAAAAVTALGAFYAFAVLPGVALAAQQARGDYRGSAVGILLLGLASLAAAAAGAWLSDSATGIAVWVGSVGAIASLGYVAYALAPTGISLADILGATVPIWVIGIASGALAIGAGWGIGHVHAVIRLVLISAVFVAAFGLLTRMTMPSTLLESLALVPARLRGMAGRFLLLPAAE